MNKVKINLIIINLCFTFIFSNIVNASTNFYIVTKVDNEIITNIDIIDEANYLIALNNDLKKTNATEADLLNVITFDDFKNIELKTGKVIVVEKVEKSDKLLKLQVQIGGENRQIISGIAEYYSPEDLLNIMIVVVTNLKPATIFGNESYGMLLAAKKGKSLTLVTVDDGNVSSGMEVY